MSTPTPIVAPGHILQALSKLLTPFRGKPRFASWCAVPVNQVQSLEDVGWSLLALLDVDLADLPRLVLLGKIVGQPQRGTLEQFRRYVKVRVLVNRSGGTAPELIKIAGLLLGGPGSGPPADVTYTEYQPAAIVIDDNAPLGDADPTAAAEFLRAAKLAGVRLDLIAQFEAATDAFLLGDDLSAGVVDTTHGLSEETESAGGYLAGVY